MAVNYLLSILGSGRCQRGGTEQTVRLTMQSIGRSHVRGTRRREMGSDVEKDH